MRRAVAARAQALGSRARAQPAPEADGRTSLNRAPGPLRPRSSEPPCASAIARASHSPIPVEPAPLAAARERIEAAASTPGPVVRHVDHDPAVALPHLDRHGRRRAAARSRRGSRAPDGASSGPPSTAGSPCDETTTSSEASPRASAPTSTGSGRSERSRGSETSRSMSRPAATASATSRRRVRRRAPSGAACGERRERGDGASQLVGDDPEPLARRSCARSAIRATARRGRDGERVVGVGENGTAAPLVAGPARCSRARRARSGGASEGRSAGRRAGRAPRSSSSPSRVEPVDERDRGRRVVARERLARRAASRPRGSRGRRPGRCRSRRRGRRARPSRRRASRRASASSTRGSGSSRARRARRAHRSGTRRCRACSCRSPRRAAGVASSSTSVTSVPSTTQDPCVRVISIVFLPMKPTPDALRAGTVDVVVRVDEHAVGAAEPAAERVQALPQERVVVAPRVPRQPPLPGRRLGPARVVAERRRDHGPRAFEQRLGVARDLRPAPS